MTMLSTTCNAAAVWLQRNGGSEAHASRVCEQGSSSLRAGKLQIRGQHPALTGWG